LREQGCSTLCEARQRLGVEPVRNLHALVVRLLATSETPGGILQRDALDGHRRDRSGRTPLAASNDLHFAASLKTIFLLVDGILLIPNRSG
jgi:hypothetical protein